MTRPLFGDNTDKYIDNRDSELDFVISEARQADEVEMKYVHENI